MSNQEKDHVFITILISSIVLLVGLAVVGCGEETTVSTRVDAAVKQDSGPSRVLCVPEGEPEVIVAKGHLGSAHNMVWLRQPFRLANYTKSLSRLQCRATYCADQMNTPRNRRTKTT